MRGTWSHTKREKLRFPFDFAFTKKLIHMDYFTWNILHGIQFLRTHVKTSGGGPGKSIKVVDFKIKFFFLFFEIMTSTF